MRFNINCIFVFVAITLITSCTGFNRLRHIVGQYYLIEVDTKTDLSICYYTSQGEYVGRIPSTIMEYGYNDAFIIAKISDHQGAIQYYIVDRKKDFDLAREEDYRSGPLTELEYQTRYNKNLNVHLKTAD